MSRAFILFRILRRSIAVKIIIPYLILMLILALLAAYVTTTLIAGSLEESIRAEPGLADLTLVLQERSAQARYLVIGIFGGASLVVLGLGLLLARQITRPLSSLVEAAQRIRRNELDFELPVQTQDEIGTLTQAFNEMTSALREREPSRVGVDEHTTPTGSQLVRSGEMRMGGDQREITVFKTDIRGFSALAETLDPDALVQFLNHYFTRMVTCIHKHGGEVDKYMGDAILAKFGAADWYPDHAHKAVLSMIEIIEACEDFSEELRAEGRSPIRMGVGCNTGLAVVGNVGSPDRMEHTVISDAVNTSERIEELCDQFGWDLLISGTTYEQAKDSVEVGEPWTLELRGQTRDTYIYPVLGRKGQVPPHRLRAYEALRTRGRSTYADPSAAPETGPS